MLWTIQGISIPFLYSQQEANFSLYMFNHQVINPAYTGTHDYTQITLVNHSQWLQIEGAPQTQALSISNLFSDKVGLGVSLVNDQIGPTQKTNASIDFGYHLNLNKQNLKLSLGLKVSNRFNTIDYSMLNVLEQTDLSFVSQAENNSHLNFGVGFYLYNKRFYLGLASPFLLENDFTNTKRNYYLILGGLIRLNDSFELKPSLLFQSIEGTNTVYDNSIWIVFKNQFWIGPQYRSSVKNILPSPSSSGHFGAIAGVHLNKSMSLGYAYQGKVGNQSIGITNTSHEIVLRIRLVPNQRNIVISPRIF
ncbi:MAG: PorP/SprF family type IX secretion system membrane protein [Flavobacteriaceae bacterium]